MTFRSYAAGCWTCWRLARSAERPPITKVCFALCLAAFASSVPRASAQILEHFNPLSYRTNGLHFYGASVSSMFSTGSGAGFGLGIPITGTPDVSRRITTLQASGSFGWSRTIRKNAVSLTYAPGYVRGLSGTRFDSTNHSSAFSLNRSIGTKWRTGASLSAVLSDFNQLPFGGARARNMLATPASFQDMADIVLTGASDNIALMQTVNMAPTLTSPETAFLYGGRVFSVAAGVSAGYAYSSRAGLSFNLNAGRTQSVNAGNTSSAALQNSVIPRTTSGGFGVGWTYSLTPRTSIGATMSTGRAFSSLQDAWANQAGLTFGRTLTSRWFVSGTAGVGWITPIRTTLQPKMGPQLTYGVSTGYKLYSHAFVGSITRSVSDVYAIGANASESGSFAWVWKPPAGSLSITSGVGYSRIISPLIRSSRSWSGFVSTGRALTRQLAVSVAYNYARFPASLLIARDNLTQSGAVVSLSWSPSERR